MLKPNRPQSSDFDIKIIVPFKNQFRELAEKCQKTCLIRDPVEEAERKYQVCAKIKEL